MTDSKDLTTRRDAAVADLRRVIRQAPLALRDTIADYDSQALPGDTPKHRAALDRLIDEFDCVLRWMPDSTWYPSEPIELASFGVDGQGSIVTSYACCFLLIDDLVDGRMGHFDYRLSDSPGRAFFDTAPDPYRGPLLTGIAVWEEANADLRW